MAKPVDAADLKSASLWSAGSSPAVRTTPPTRTVAVAALLALALLGGCRRERAKGPIVVSAIGRPLGADDARGRVPDTAADGPAATLALATRQGLVRFDAAGQVAPGLAQRWIVTDDGRSLLFRLDDAPGTVGAPDLARRLRAALAPGAGNPLRPLLGAVASIEGVTPQVVDVELKAPRPDILALFAQPALTVAAARRDGGPFVLIGFDRGVARLRAPTDPDRDPDRPAPPPMHVTLRGERAATAVARFAAGAAELVVGGRFQDLAVARVAGLSADRLRFDPAPGLFGFAIAPAAQGFLALARNRSALAMAVDRTRIGRVLDLPNWAPREAIVPAGLPEIAAPASPAWADAALDDRRAAAAAIVREWREGGEPAPTLRVAMPEGPGARLLFALIAADWRAIGIATIAVGADEPADLQMVDEVAPADSAAFYLRRFACERRVACTAEADAVLVAARATPSLAERSALFARADALIAATAPFVALGTPLRWSLVAPGLTRFRESPRAIHPLDELRPAPDR